MLLDLLAMLVVTLALFVWLKERVLYVIFPWAYVQNFVLPWGYTSGWADEKLCRALLTAKDFLLLWLFLFLLPKLRRCGQGKKWPAPLGILAVFTGWCVIRQVAAGLVQQNGWLQDLFRLRDMCFPLEVLTVAIVVTWMNPEFARRFIRRMTYLAAGLALFGILLYAVAGTFFYTRHVNIAAYDENVKGSNNLTLENTALWEGVTGNGVRRTEFSFLGRFRAFGTIGDAVGFGHFVAFPLLLLAFWLPSGWKQRLLLTITAIALLLSFTRSAWIFAAVGLLYVLLRKRRYRLVFGVGGAGALALLAWAPLRRLYSATLSVISWTQPQNAHARGFVWPYKEGLWQAQNILGSGVPKHLMESGYGNMLVMYGLPAFFLIVWFLIALYRVLRQVPIRNKALLLVVQALPLVLLVDLNFSYYPFSFIPYLLTWFVVGACLAATNATWLGRANGRSLAFINLVKVQQ